MLLGARQFFAARKSAPLPYDAEVEYLESTGTQYIDTGISPAVDLGCEIDYLITGYGPSMDANIIMLGNDSWRWGFGYRGLGDTLQVNGLCVMSFVNYTVSVVRSVVQYNYNESRQCGLNGSLLRDNLPTGSNTSNYGVFIFGSCNPSDGTLWRPGKMKLYGCKMTKGTEVVRDYIPVRKDGVGYIYDRVSGQLFRNQGTGAFLYGSDRS